MAGRSSVMMNKSSGSNCCIVDCHANSTNCRGLCFPKLPRKGVSAEQDEYRRVLIRIIDRKDKSFNENTARICSRHFEASGINYGPSGKCSGLVLGSIPIYHMPRPVTLNPSRPGPTDRPPPSIPDRVSYYNFDDVRKDLTLVESPWIVQENMASSFQVSLPSERGYVTVTLAKENSEKGTLADVTVFGSPAPHLSIDLEKKKLLHLLKELQDMRVCPGITDADLQDLADAPDGRTSYYRHMEYNCVNGKVTHISSVKSTRCELLLLPSSPVCQKCVQIEKVLLQKTKRLAEAVTKPIHPNAPLHNMLKAQLKEAFKQTRLENNRLQKELQLFKEKMEEESVHMNEAMHSSLCAVDTGQLKEGSLQKLFWEEQQKALTCKAKGMRWHPMIIRLAIMLQSKSKAAYETLRKTGVLKLPGTTTLREYTSANSPEAGFRPAVMEELRKEAAKLPETQRYVVLLHDEMTIRSDLMFDQRSGFLVGFVNKDNWTFDTDREKVATHALVFYVVGVNSTLKMSVGYFGTTGATSDELMPLFWTAIGCLEECGWKVVASTSDKASPNQRLYQLHQVPGVSDVCFKAVNLHAPEREVFFISDAPHLIKTVRNNLESSGKNTRLLWKDGFKLLWSHISDVREADRARGLRMTKLENAHNNLTPHSKMNVSLAAQVLSNRVGRVMQTYGKPEVQETAKFVLLMDRFFDCLNTRHLKEGERKLKPDLDAYTDVNDPRFQFLEDFLQYLEDWRTSVDNRNDQPYTRADRQKMFLTHQTYRGLVMTVRAFIGVTRFLLANGVSFILSNKFCQDPIEEHFGRHRAMKRTAENPSLYEFGHQENSILLQRQLALIITPRGNSRGAHHEPPQVDLSISPLKKKKNN